MTQSLKSIKANAIVSATSSITTSTNIGGNLLPTGNVTYDIGSSTARWKDIYLSNNTIYLGNTAVSANSILPINLDIAPEVLTINVAAPFPGDDISWLWNWQTSTLPYARTTIVNSAQVSVPLYKQGTYQINNFANEQTGNMTQRHVAHLKWIDGAGTQNLVSWAVESGNVSFSDANINSGANTNVQRINVSVPASITLPTLVAPNITSYMTVSYANTGAYTFSGNGDGDNRTLGPLYRGGSYTFTLDSSLSNDPFYFTTDNGTNWSANAYYGEYTTGVTGSRNNGTTSNTTIKIVVDANAPDVLFYQSATDANKRGAIVIKDLAVETNVNGNYILYFQHGGEGHKTPVEIRPIPSLVNQMCVVYDASVGKFVPQDLATYVENTPSFKNKIREVAGTATLIAPNGVAVVPTVLVVEDTTYLPLINNKEGDIAFDAYANTIYVWHSGAWNYTKPTSYAAANVVGTVANATYAITSGTSYSVSAANISGTVNLANYATTANSVAGSNVSGVVANATYAVTSGTSYSVAGGNVTGQVSNALISGTVYTNAQPNITSVGTLTDLSVSGNATISGNLTVTGTTTTINSTTVTVNDLNLVLANNASSASAANGAGITINGAGATMNYISSSNSFTFSHKIAADGSLLTSLAGANVSGYVPNANIANTAYSVAVANVSGIGNIATINKDGNASNILYGNGVFSAAPGGATYGNGNVATFLASYGSNTITTTGNVSVGNIIGNGQALTGLSGANVTGQVSNALVAGTVYTAAQSNITSLGTLTTLTVSGLLTATGTGIKVANIQDTSGTITINTKYSGVTGDVGITGNLTVGTSGAGNATANYFIGNGSQLTGITATNANYANFAGSVAVANVTGIGNIATINKDGNASNILYGNGVFSAAPGAAAPGGSTYGDSNVATYLPTYSGNLSPGNISSVTGTITGVVIPKSNTVTDGTSISINTDLADLFIQTNTQTTGTLTINAPSGTPVNGQKFMLRLSSTAVQIFSWNAIYVGSTDFPLPTASSGSGKYDYLGFIYNSTATKWQLLAKTFGF